MRTLFTAAPWFLILLALSSCGNEQETGQRSDTSFQLPEVGPPTFPEGTGPRVGIDGAHHNYHTATGRYRAFAELLRRDGYRVDSFESRFTPESLEEIAVLVISNALSAENETNWQLPNHSAFSAAEVDAVQSWVASGGRLMLIADHMPMPGAAADLAAALGIEFQDGFAFTGERQGLMTFRREDGSLADHAVTRSEGGGEIPFVTTFTGQGFRLAPGTSGESLMQLPEDAYILLPETAWEFSEDTPRLEAKGMSQGALVQHQRGRAALFGEAAAFSAQVQGAGRPMGMNHPDAPHNARFMLNVMRWLSEPANSRR